jgi:predicted HicB family RNase H-like nuclease
MPETTRDTPSGRTIIVRLDPETHKALRVRVAEEDTSIQKWVEALIERTLGVGHAAPKAGRGRKSSGS